MNDCSVSQDGQPLCINGGADLRDLDLKHIPKVNKHHYGLASSPVVPFILEKPAAESNFNQNNFSSFHLARAHSSSFHLTITSWFLTKASRGQSCVESANFSFRSRLRVLNTSLWLSSWKYTWNIRTSKILKYDIL